MMLHESNQCINIVGVDYLSAASYEHLTPAHLAFLKNGVRILLRANLKFCMS